MRPLCIFAGLLPALLTLSACVSHPESSTVFVGMSVERLKMRFGEPLRIEETKSGGEDWIYPCVSSQPPQMDAVTYNDGNSKAASVSVTFSDQHIQVECPIHISADGRVMAPLPEGTVIRR